MEARDAECGDRVLQLQTFEAGEIDHGNVRGRPIGRAIGKTPSPHAIILFLTSSLKVKPVNKLEL
jgi:hypothetical protein